MANTIYFKIKLINSKPTIWRQFHLTDDFRLDRFHQVIQIAMGWWNAHLHEFQLPDRTIGMVLEDMWGMEDVEDETKIFLRDLALREGDRFDYLYDFGDSWEHELKVERIVEGQALPAQCTNGKRACPIEDCGGIWGYQELLQILQDRNHPEYEEWQEWRMLVDFDPDHYPIAQVNEELARFMAWHKKHPRAKSTPWHRL
jgi:hypothetical protein